MVVATESAGWMRYRLLETLRQFARSRLEARPDATAWQLAHARSHLGTTRAAAAQLDGPDELAGVRRLEEDLEDLREAFWRSLTLGELDTALELVVTIREFAFRTIRDEVFGWAEAASTTPDAEGRPLYPLVRAVVAYGCFVRGALDEAVEIGRGAVDAAGRLGVPTRGLPERAVGNALFFRGEPQRAVRWIDRMTAAADESGEIALVAHACYMASVAHTSVGDPEGARTCATRARAAARRCGSPTAHAQASYAEGVSLERHDPDGAVRLLRESAEAAATVDNRWLRAFARTEELSVRARRGELTEALDGFRDVVETWFRGGDWANQWLSLRHLVGVFAALGEDELAAVLHGAIEAAGASVALPFEPADAARTTGLLAAARERRGPAAFDAAVTRGRHMRDEEIVRLTLRHLELAAATAAGRRRRVRR